jgi:uncharacterized protein
MPMQVKGNAHCTSGTATAQSPPMGSLCDRCSALCCRYFALQIDEPETASQFDDVRWYLVHENVVVFVEKKKWYLGFMSRCKHLMQDNRCAIYERRPRICRSYSTDNCEYHGGDYGYEKLFTSAEQLEKYAVQLLGRPIIPGSRIPKRRPRRPALKLRLVRPPEAGVADHSGNGNGKADGNGNGNGRLSLPILRPR